MVFFTDFNVSKDKKIGITNLLGNITTKPDSHKGGWTKLLRCQLINQGYKDVRILGKSDKLSDFDSIIFDLGAEFSGGLNLFGGLNNNVYERLVELHNFSGSIFSWRHELPDIMPLEKRRDNKSTCPEFIDTNHNFLINVKAILDECQKFDHVSKQKTLLIGDSHTPGIWEPTMMIERQDGRTLFGALKKGTIKELVDKLQPEALVIHMSSIDIRHHIFRQEKPMIALKDLVVELVTQLEATGIKNIAISHTMGIEDESRKLPKTGFYKGTPFMGSWAERHAATGLFNTLIDTFCEEKEWFTMSYPEGFFDEEDKLRFEVMEKPQSIHISPQFYRWDLDNNKMRWE